MKIRGTALVVFLMVAPALFAADFGVRAGRYQEAEETFVGAEVLFDAGILNINPNIEYSLEDDVTAGSVNLDLTMDIGRFSAVAPYVGAGVGLLYVDDEIGGETTDPVFNLIGGVGLKLATLTPYAQVKYFRLLEDEETRDSDEIALTIGLRF